MGWKFNDTIDDELGTNKAVLTWSTAGKLQGISSLHYAKGDSSVYRKVMQTNELWGQKLEVWGMAKQARVYNCIVKSESHMSLISFNLPNVRINLLLNNTLLLNLWAFSK